MHCSPLPLHPNFHYYPFKYSSFFSVLLSFRSRRSRRLVLSNRNITLFSCSISLSFSFTSRPFPSSVLPQCENESWRKIIPYENVFHLHIDFHANKNFCTRTRLKQGQKATWKCPIPNEQDWINFISKLKTQTH